MVDSVKIRRDEIVEVSNNYNYFFVKYKGGTVSFVVPHDKIEMYRRVLNYWRLKS